MEAVQTLIQLSNQPDADEDALGWGALQQVNPGGHFFDTDQTMARYRDAFYEPLIAELSNFGAWTDYGAIPSDKRATATWQSIVAGFTPPPQGVERADRIADYISQGTAKGGAPILD